MVPKRRIQTSFLDSMKMSYMSNSYSCLSVKSLLMAQKRARNSVKLNPNKAECEIILGLGLRGNENCMTKPISDNSDRIRQALDTYFSSFSCFISLIVLLLCSTSGKASSIVSLCFIISVWSSATSIFSSQSVEYLASFVL